MLSNRVKVRQAGIHEHNAALDTVVAISLADLVKRAFKVFLFLVLYSILHERQLTVLRYHKVTCPHPKAADGILRAVIPEKSKGFFKDGL